MRPLLISVLLLASLPALAVELARITPEAEVQARSAGLAVVHRYSDFVLVAGDSAADLQAAAQKGVKLSAEPHGYRLALPYQAAVDPLRAVGTAIHSDEVTDGLALVQFVGPILPQWLQELQQRDIQIIAYIHPYTYLVWQQNAALHSARTESADTAIRWIGAWPLHARVAPELRRNAEASTEVRLLSWKTAAPSRTDLSERSAQLLEQVDLNSQLQLQRLRVPGEQIDALAALPGVLSVQSVPPGDLRGEISSQHLAGNLSGDQPLPDYRGWLTAVGVDGTGVRVAHVDDSLDANHPDLIARIWPCSGSTCATGAGTAHGTHTAGILAGDGAGGIREATGVFLRGLGVAPGVLLVPQNWNPHFSTSGGMLLLMQQSHANGAVLSNNSWGSSNTPRGYDLDTRLVDIGVRDADNALAGDQPLTYVLSIANRQAGISDHGAPDEAKNSITVGATRLQSSQSFVVAQWRDLASTSGFGPALDGRRIPSLVAPGCQVDSTVLAPFFHGLQCGTSMAAPHVSGALALYAELFKRQHLRWPSPALAKAAVQSATRDLVGRMDATGATLGHRPDARQGWGQLQLDRLLSQLSDSYHSDQTHVFTTTGQSWSAALEVRDSAEPIEIMLVWTDAPGHGLCAGPGCNTPAWNNDLNLEVTAGASQFKGNVFNAQGTAVSGGLADEKNNSEAVIFEAGRISGAFTVTVRAANITSDALPNSPGSLQQDFALYCVNCVEPPIFSNGME